MSPDEIAARRLQREQSRAAWRSRAQQGESLNPQQFEQLTLFERTEDVIRDVHKIDSDSYPNASPWAQWRDVRDVKLSGANSRGYLLGDTEGMPPLRIQHVDSNRGYARRNSRPQRELWDGHHRLAAAEYRGMPLVPVIHSANPREGLSDRWPGIQGYYEP